MPDPGKPSELPLDGDLWRELRHLMDWHEGFTLVLLYSDDPAALDAIRGRMQDALRFQTAAIQHVVPASPASATADIVGALQADARFPSRRPPVWIDLQGSPGDDAWNRARDHVLARLNEQRSRLEREVPGLLVLSLPTHYIARIGGIAPDLWSVRTLSREVRACRPAVLPHPPFHRDVPATPQQGPASPPSEREALLFAEWSRWRDGTHAHPPSSQLVEDLVELSLERGDLVRAGSIASELVTILRSSTREEATPSINRALAVAWRASGRVASRNGHWDRAAQAWRESLGIRRRLVEQLGPSPEALRDLSTVLEWMASWERDHGTPGAELATLREWADVLTRSLSVAADPGAAVQKRAAALARIRELESITHASPLTGGPPRAEGPASGGAGTTS